MAEYTYDGDLIVSSTLNSFSYVYTYNSQGLMTEKETYNQGGLLTCKNLYSYSQSGNPITLTDCGNGVFTFSYDTKQQPITLWGINAVIKIGPTGPNNYVGYTFENSLNPEENHEVAVDYTYNAEGYPTKSMTYIEGELKQINTFSYEQQ